jgi:hypothetical protein
LIFDIDLISLLEGSNYENKQLIIDLKRLIENFLMIISEKYLGRKFELILNIEKGLKRI